MSNLKAFDVHLQVYQVFSSDAMVENTSSSMQWHAAGLASPLTGIEPHPDWSLAHDQWSAAWPVHIYGLGSLFVLLAVYALLILAVLSRRHPLLAYTALAIFALGASRGFVMLVDPYASANRLPLAMVLVLQAATSPCLIAIFTLLELSIMMRVRQPTERNIQRFLIGLLLAHLALVACIYVVVAVHPQLKLLVLLSQAIFITWGLVLCFVFVYNAFKITQFSHETTRVLHQIATYSRVKKSVQGGRHLALHRIRKPRIRKSSTEVYPLSGEEEGEESEHSSEESLCFFNEAHFELNEAQLEAACRQHLQQQNIQPNSSNGDSSCSSNNNSKRKRSHHESATEQLKSKRCIRDTLHSIGPSRDGYHSLANPTTLVLSDQQACKPDDDDAEKDEEDKEQDEEDESHEGYMADTDSPKSNRKHKNAAENETPGSPSLGPYPLPAKDNSLGLWRIRRGRVLREVLKLTYTCTFFAFLCCVLQLYAMFGVYGVLSNETVSQPWPWLSFMSLSRWVYSYAPSQHRHRAICTRSLDIRCSVISHDVIEHE